VTYLPNRALDAVAANVNGPVTNLSGAHAKLAMQVLLTGAPTGGTVTLQGSLDGTNFDTSGTGLAQFTIGTDASGAIKFAIDKPVSFYRVALAGLAGGTNPTVTAIVAVAAP